MSHQPTDHNETIVENSPDLLKLRDQGHNIEVYGGNTLVIHDVPYVNSKGEVMKGTMVTSFEAQGHKVKPPTDHKMWFRGEQPCETDGSHIARIKHSSPSKTWPGGITTDHMFSNKPQENGGRYVDYFQKVGVYYRIVSEPATKLAPDLEGYAYRKPEVSEIASPFLYPETASSRAGIVSANKKLALSDVAIIGVGGTGACILDHVAKTYVQRIHLFDGDEFINHNAFRAPGAASADEVGAGHNKAEYFSDKYSVMRTGVIANPIYIDETNLNNLDDMAFVFIAIDNNPARKIIVEYLEFQEIPFIDVGIGVYNTDDTLGGNVRTTISHAENREEARKHLKLGANSDDNEYVENIQVAELNTMNAVLAVIKWKKYMGFYQERGNHTNRLYSIGWNEFAQEGNIDE